MAEEKRMRRIQVVLMILAVPGMPALADMWWHTYEANGTYPEDDGWSRIVMGGGAERWFQDGTLVLDSRASNEIVDAYYQYMPSLPDPGQEIFLAQWRLRVVEDSGGDPGIGISFGPPGDVLLEYELNRIYSTNEFEYVADFQAGVFHEYALTTSDLASYALYVDGALVHVGQLNAPGFGAWLEWGDPTSGRTSLTEWDWVRFGVVPEPSAGLLLGVAFAGMALGRALRRRTLQ
jgi:hypothetical protein